MLTPLYGLILAYMVPFTLQVCLFPALPAICPKMLFALGLSSLLAGRPHAFSLPG